LKELILSKKYTPISKKCKPKHVVPTCRLFINGSEKWYFGLFSELKKIENGSFGEKSLGKENSGIIFQFSANKLSFNNSVN
jgi:hypothetical protein